MCSHVPCNLKRSRDNGGSQQVRQQQQRQSPTPRYSDHCHHRRGDDETLCSRPPPSSHGSASPCHSNPDRVPLAPTGHVSSGKPLPSSARRSNISHERSEVFDSVTTVLRVSHRISCELLSPSLWRRDACATSGPRGSNCCAITCCRCAGATCRRVVPRGHNSYSSRPANRGTR
jgi:hypothetical protein